MHQIIRIICYANDKREARERAEEILKNNLVGDNCPFDYGTFFDDDISTMSGKARWGYNPSVVLADSKEGKKLIKEGMKYTKESFIEKIKEVREMINFYSNEELFEKKVIDIKKKILESLENKKDKKGLGISFFKYYCSCLGEYKGSNIFLYDNDGEGISDSQHLKDVLTKWKSFYGTENKEKNKYIGLKVFVVPIDVHS